MKGFAFYFYIPYESFLILNIATVIIVNAIKASRGIVMNPSQLMYCPEHGTPLVQT